MKKSRSRDWLQILGHFSVVAGLLLVAYQIHQSSHFIRAELGSNATDRYLAVNQILANPDMAAVWAKSHAYPENLTLEEMVHLEGYLSSLVANLIAEAWLYDLEIYEPALDHAIPYFADIIGGNKFAVAWWAETKVSVPPHIVEKMDKRMASVAAHYDLKRYERMRSQL